MKEEIWKDIKGYEGYYQVSNLGRIKSLQRNGTIKKDRILKPNNVKGYLQITLQKNGIKAYKKIHRIVAENFITNINNKTEVNHIDGNKHNNCIENLEWVTKSENQKHAYKLGLNKSHGIKGEKNVLSKKIMQLDLEDNVIKIWGSMHDIERKLGIKYQNVYACCKGIQNKTHNFKFKYYK